jgi:hypothetical protein
MTEPVADFFLLTDNCFSQLDFLGLLKNIIHLQC